MHPALTVGSGPKRIHVGARDRKEDKKNDSTGRTRVLDGMRDVR